MPIETQPVPILEYDTAQTAYIEANRHGAPPLPRVCVLTFFGEVLNALVAAQSLSILDTYESEMRPFPVYGHAHEGTPVCLMQAAVGAPSAAMQAEFLFSRGVRVLVACGGCGVLTPIAAGEVIVPTVALRDEGVSYHYLPPSREISLDGDAVRALLSLLYRRGIPHIACKTWTTDAFYRETPAMVARRAQEGCRVVEMECAALAAVARFRGTRFAQLLYSGDHVNSDDGYNDRNWAGNLSDREALFALALDAAIRLPRPDVVPVDHVMPHVDTPPPFRFLHTEGMTDGTIALRLRETRPADPSRGFVPAYHFHIVNAADETVLGRIDLRVGDLPALYYSGHIGYEVLPPFRGERIAGRAARLLLPLAWAHGINPLYITCRPDNLPSYRTIRALGATLLEVADTPEDHPLWQDPAERRLCIFKLSPPNGRIPHPA